MTADCSVGWQKATKWLNMRVTCEWHYSGGLVRVTPQECCVGVWIQGKQMGIQCNTASLSFFLSRLSISSTCQLRSQNVQQMKVQVNKLMRHHAQTLCFIIYCESLLVGGNFATKENNSCNSVVFFTAHPACILHSLHTCPKLRLQYNNETSWCSFLFILRNAITRNSL